MEFVHNPEGYIRYYGPNEHYHFYYIKDLLGNIRETYVQPEAGYKECIQRMQYYPSGLPWAEAAGASKRPWKYNGKEFVEMHGLDEYDSKARWYYPAIYRTTTMDPLAEKYYSISPYAWCGNNPVRNIDPDGKEWLDIAGRPIKNHLNIQAYILYNFEEFGGQSKIMAQTLEEQYGSGSVALSSAITEKEFAQDWIDMVGVKVVKY
jgi:RHS repeat-associated protein